MAKKKERIKLTFQNYRLENKSLKENIVEVQEEISLLSVPVSTELSDDMVTIISNADHSKVSPFKKFFWEELQKFLKSSSTGICYHPMVISYCLSLAAKPSSAYTGKD